MFDRVKGISPSRSKHKLYNKHYFDTHIGWFVPVWWYDCAPTTSIKLNFQLMVRSKLIPQELYGDLKAYVNAFFVAYRNLDKEFEDNITGGDGKNVVSYHQRGLSECLDSSNADVNQKASSWPYSLHDYLGLPCIWPEASDYDSSNHHLKPKYKEKWIEDELCPYLFAGYHKIWNEYCRPEHFIDDDFYDCSEVPASVTNRIGYHPFSINAWVGQFWCNYFNDSTGFQNNWTYSGIRRVCNNRDYFVACLPTQQRGTAPTISMQGVLPVDFFEYEDFDKWEDVLVHPASGSLSVGYDSTNGMEGVIKNPLDPSEMESTDLGADFKAVMGVDVQNSIGFDITDIRVASAIQKWQEIANVCGTRYTEYLRGMFGASPRDDRLQRPEWIGGCEVDLNQFVTTTTADSATSSVGDEVVRVGGRGNVNLGNYFAPEYGAIIVTMHIKPENTYLRGVHRSFIKESRYDWFNPLFSGIGEDAVRNSEVWVEFSNNGSVLEHGKETFGFMQRNGAMCTSFDYSSGSFREGGEDNIKLWSRKFSTQPNLNTNFLMCKESDYSDVFGSAVGVPFECLLQSYCDAVLPVPANPSPADVAVKY